MNTILHCDRILIYTEEWIWESSSKWSELELENLGSNPYSASDYLCDSGRLYFGATEIFPIPYALHALHLDIHPLSSKDPFPLNLDRPLGQPQPTEYCRSDTCRFQDMTLRMVLTSALFSGGACSGNPALKLWGSLN